MTGLFLLPDELWISILSEWIDKPITLCSFDISFCNGLLRQRYFSSWLDAVTFGIFSQIHFEPIFASERFQTKCSCGVFRLVWEEEYFPYLTFLVMRNDEDDSGWKCTIPSKALNAMSFMETLNTSCKATYNKFTNTGSCFLNVLNDFCFVQSWSICLLLFASLPSIADMALIHYKQ